MTLQVLSLLLMFSFYGSSMSRFDLAVTHNRKGQDPFSLLTLTTKMRVTPKPTLFFLFPFSLRSFYR